MKLPGYRQLYESLKDFTKHSPWDFHKAPVYRGLHKTRYRRDSQSLWELHETAEHRELSKASVQRGLCKGLGTSQTTCR